ncbi:MAG TPA: sialate O-acetylesterase [Abditibacteriaceae bacterium]|nr:sialate O-acetylesterase [Abditibacteriaceae bacterium]
MSDRPENLDVWVLAGQSNMQGVGELDAVLAPDERVWSFSSAGRWEIAEEPLHRLWESFTPVHQNFMRAALTQDQRNVSNEEIAAREAESRTTGGGLGIAFGRSMADAVQRPIGLIPAAHGGTSLEQWSTQLKSEGGHSLYGAMLERIERAEGVLKGVLWYQGESDALTPEVAPSYGERFAAWVQQLRTDLAREDLPVIVVQLGRFTSPVENTPVEKAWDEVRQAQYDLPETVPHTGVTSAVDLGLVDPIHINAYGLIRLGKRLARVALALAEGSVASAGPRVEKIEKIAGLPGYGALKITCSGVTEGWQPQDHIAGFAVYNADGSPHAENRVYNAHPDKAHPSNIILRLNGEINDGDLIGYARGVNPYCNAVDEADMPLCSFLRRVE